MDDANVPSLIALPQPVNADGLIVMAWGGLIRDTPTVVTVCGIRFQEKMKQFAVMCFMTRQSGADE